MKALATIAALLLLALAASAAPGVWLLGDLMLGALAVTLILLAGYGLMAYLDWRHRRALDRIWSEIIAGNHFGPDSATLAYMRGFEYETPIAWVDVEETA